ncbi:Protein kinase [Ascosphaera pollenicola]|nr:Protein kinase [Ascosphaera pollenicola]
MPLQIPSSRITLSIPLMTADFDPRDSRYLLVGGGGGEGRTGVLLDTSNPDELLQLQEIELSPDEDSVTSLGIAHSAPGQIVAFGGVNSSQEQQDQGNNEHLRSFRLSYLPDSPSTTDGPSATLSKVSLFRPPPAKAGVLNEAYQKLLRLSPWASEASRRIAVISTGMQDKGEIVAFEASSTSPQPSDVLARIRLGQGEEAEDIDIVPTEDNKFRVAYTDGKTLFTFDTLIPNDKSASVAPASTPEPKGVYTIPQNLARAKIRSLKFLSPTAFVILQNLPDRSGCELLICADGMITRRKKLTRDMKMGLGLDVSPLPVDKATGERQFVVAVSGSNHAIDIFTVDYRGGNGKNSYSSFKRWTTIQNVHGFTITKIALSNFISPVAENQNNEKMKKDIIPLTRPFIKLVSVSVGNTVVVHSLPLTSYPSKSEPKRYVLRFPTTSSHDFILNGFCGVSAILVIILSAILLQAVAEIRGSVPPTLGAKQWLHPRIHDAVARPYNGLKANEPSAEIVMVGESEVPVLESRTPAFEVTTEGITFETLNAVFTEEEQEVASSVEAVMPISTDAEDVLTVQSDMPKEVISEPTLSEKVEGVPTSGGNGGEKPVKEAPGPQGSSREEYFLDEWFLD